jgi:cytochrome P450
VCSSDLVELVSGYVTTLRHGLEMTAHLLGNGMLALATDPDQQCLLRHRLDELMPTALDEILRIDPPVQAVVRRLTVSRIVGGTYITAPAQIAIMIGAGNHDPAHFTSPESLRVDRAESAPLSYGADVPTCTGGRLAHLLAEVFFTTMLRRFSDVQLGAAPSYRPDRMLRGLRELHVNALNAA